MSIHLKPIWLGLVASSLFLSGVAMAAEEAATEAAAAEAAAPMTTEEAQKLIADKGYICMACHQVETKMVGPSYVEIAERYADPDDELKARLADQTIKGKMTDLSWGQAPMPPNPTVTEEDSVALIAWILSLDAGEAATEEAPAEAPAEEAAQ